MSQSPPQYIYLSPTLGYMCWRSYLNSATYLLHDAIANTEKKKKSSAGPSDDLPASARTQMIINHTAASIQHTIKHAVHTEMQTFQHKVTRVLDDQPASISTGDFLTKFKRFFQIYGEDTYFEKVVASILDDGPLPDSTECMRAVVVNLLPGVPQKAPSPSSSPRVPSTNRSKTRRMTKKMTQKIIVRPRRALLTKFSLNQGFPWPRKSKRIPQQASPRLNTTQLSFRRLHQPGLLQINHFQAPLSTYLAQLGQSLPRKDQKVHLSKLRLLLLPPNVIAWPSRSSTPDSPLKHYIWPSWLC